MGKASKQRIVLSILLVVLLLPFSVTGEEEPAWKSNGIDPSTWSDGPVVEHLVQRALEDQEAVQVK